MKRMMTTLALITLLCACSEKKLHQDTESGENTDIQSESAQSEVKKSPINAPTESTPGQEATFQRLSDEMIERMWHLFPTWAISNGYYQVAEMLEIPDNHYRQQVLTFARDYRNRFGKFQRNALDVSARTDHALINNFLHRTIWNIEEFRPHEWDPSIYNVAHGFALILNTDYAPIDDRLRTFSTRMQNIPAYYAAAEKSLRNPAAPQLILAIEQNEGASSVFGEELESRLASSGLSDKEKELFNSRLTAARQAIEEYIVLLQTLQAQMDNANSFTDFRIGKKLYEEKFHFDIQIGLSGEQLYQRALKEKDNLHLEMDELADKLWPKYFPNESRPKDILAKIGKVLEKLSEHHVTKENFLDEVKRQIPQLASFVKEKKLLSLDEDKPLVVRTTPPYMRGFAVASINAPGPYDKDANTYYNVMSVADLPDERADSFLREYNTYLMQILNIHEAIPGHYTQLVYANKSPSLIKNILGNGAMIEGWAVYAERMMLEAGYGNFSPELWMMYYKWNLRTVVNTILDYSVQVKEMSEPAAMYLLMDQGFQQKTEALGKWRRATLSQVQLTSYFAGYTDIMALREEIQQLQGDKFNLRAFHEQFLSYGNAPVPVIRELMLAKLEEKK